jgi:hypothetical protein
MSHHWNSKQLTDALPKAAVVDCLRSGYQFAPEAGRPVVARISRTLGNPEEGS